MREVRDAIAEILERTTLATVCRKVEKARQQKRDLLALTYEVKSSKTIVD
jgi:DNA-binding IscR family transcriptional regulator